MRNPALEALDVLVGSWEITLTNAWFLESLDVEQHGRAEVRWLGDAFIAETPSGREGEPEGVAKFAVYLASDDSRLVTGQALSIDGGASLKRTRSSFPAAPDRPGD